MSDSKLNQVFLYLPLTVLEKDRILNSWNRFPKISFGITSIEGYENIYKAVDAALESGYRSFDCSSHNNQEKDLGNALEELLSKHKLSRNDVIISGKIHPKNYGSETASEAFWRSCENFKTSYLDVYFMQWPGGHNLDFEDEENRRLRQETWKEMVKLRSEGVIKNLGVCHFTAKHLEDIRESSCVVPAINQVEFHPRCQQLELREYCQEKNILLQASSFKDSFHQLLLSDKTVQDVSKLVSRTPAQVLLKWIINKGVAVIPQSESTKRIKQNFQLFDFVLEKPEMDVLNSIGIREKYIRNPLCVV